MNQRPNGFQYTKAYVMYLSMWKDGAWDEGTLDPSDQLTISGLSTALHYGQECFEGLKAYRRKDGRVQLFRIIDNARRFQTSCERLMMPKFPVERFIDAVKKTVLANIDFVPQYGFNDSLYIRPFMIGIGDNLGLRPAPMFLFCIIVSPVGSYFDGEVKPVAMVTTDYDRAAPHGMGDVKVGGNYAASLLSQVNARKEGYADSIFLDPLTHTKIEEAGAANFFGITKEGTYITPKSPSILNSITNRSLKYLAKDILHMNVIEGDIFIDDLSSLDEAGACGTAAMITPIASITHHGKKHLFPHHETMGPYTKKLYTLLSGIQYGDIDDPLDWITIL